MVVALLALATPLLSQDWNSLPLDELRGDRRVTPKQAAYFATDAANLHELLFMAPQEAEVRSENSPIEVRIPRPDGSSSSFRIVRYYVSAPGDALRFPDIATWYGTNPDLPGQTVFLDWTPRGFHAAVSGGGMPSFYLDPVARDNQDQYQVYYRQELPTDKAGFTCGTEPDALIETETLPLRSFGDCALRQYTIAISATPAYSNYHEATSPAQSALVHSAVVTTINRVNQVFTRDLSLRLQLAEGNDQLYFYGQNDNPFSSNDVSDLLNENTAIIDERLGAGTYALGHVFTQGEDNGLARLRSGCSEFWPGAGATSLIAPEGDIFDIDYVSHEIGHQVGANHTQNNSCNYSSRAGMEPGSGSSIMGYAGICPPNVQSNSDGYFHGRSIQEITAFLEVGEGNGCATIINTSLTSPSLSGDSSFTVPFGTPLRLRASASGDGELTHNWEQYDAEQAVMPPNGNSNSGPLFRSFSPVSDTFRHVPSLLSVLSGFDPVWEEIPMVSRSLNFRMTTRNTSAAYGCAGEFDVALTVDGNNGPFAVTDPATGNQWSAGQIAQVRWDVAGTDASAFASPTVDILITYNNGQDFTLLSANEPNDGYAEVIAPGELSGSARILVRSTDNVFYNVGRRGFSIVTNDGAPGFALSALSPLGLSDCFTVRDTVSFRLMLDGNGGAEEIAALTLDGLPNGVTATFSPAFIRPGGSFSLLLSGLSELDQGSYNATISATSSEAAASINLNLDKLAEEPGPGPAIEVPGGEIDNTRPTLLARSNGMETYEFQLADDPQFSNLLYSTIRPDTFYTLPDYLEPLTQYYWRVRSRQVNGGCAISQWSAADFFSGSCYRFAAEGGPATIGSGPPPQLTEMPVSLPIGGEVLDLDVHNLSIDHSYIGDLRIELVSPSGTVAELVNRVCGSNNNLQLSFDEQSPAATLPCPPVAPSMFLPTESQSLSAFNGEPVNGKWALRTTDLANQDGGSLNGFALVVCLDNLTLPVTFLSFTATGRKDDILLSWETEREENNAGFYVERAPNANSGQWEDLGFVASSAAYRFTDETARPNVDYLYRLRQTDLDGRVSYSEIQPARIGGDAKNTLVIFPNPTSGELTFTRIGQETSLAYQLMDVSGRQLAAGLLRGNSGKLSLATFPAGIYLLRTATGQVHRIVKL